MAMIIRKLLIPIAVFMAGTAPGGAAIEPSDYRSLNDVLVETHVIPRYSRFASAAQQFKLMAEEACAVPSLTRMAALRDAGLTALDAWEAVQHIRFGPVERDMRASRIEFWPDLRDSTSKEVSALLEARDKAALAPAAIARAHVVVQGFPALERLLFDEDSVKLLADGTVDAYHRCSLVAAIAANLANMAGAIKEEWTAGDGGFARTVSAAGAPLAQYQQASEATLDLFKSMHGAVETVADHKLARPMGGSIDHAFPKRAESWRSGQSLNNIIFNLQAAQAMYLGEDGSGKNGFSRFVTEVAKDTALDDLVRRAFAQTLATAKSVKGPLKKAVSNPDERPKLEKLLTETQALKAILARRLTKDLSIPLGFNALDGD